MDYFPIKINNKMSTAVKSAQRNDQKSALPNTEVSKRVVRNLKEEFDDYTLNDDYSFEEKSDQTPAKRLNPSNDSILKQNVNTKQKQAKQSKQKKNGAETEDYEVNKIPKSYLMAMKHLQELVEKKDQEIEDMKAELVQREKYALDCETRINQSLKKCQQLSLKLQKKDSDIDLLNRQNEEMRMDKDAAIKQAAKAMEGEFRMNMSEDYLVRMDRSKTINDAPRSFPSNAVYSGFNNPFENTQNLNEQLRRNNFESKSQVDYEHEQMSSVPPLMSYRVKEKNFISYQREILRTEKEIIALKYRMECLERKLSSDQNKEDTKHKIRKLSQEISNKERTLNDLKKLI